MNGIGFDINLEHMQKEDHNVHESRVRTSSWKEKDNTLPGAAHENDWKMREKIVSCKRRGPLATPSLFLHVESSGVEQLPTCTRGVDNSANGSGKVHGPLIKQPLKPCQGKNPCTL